MQNEKGVRGKIELIENISTIIIGYIQEPSGIIIAIHF